MIYYSGNPEDFSSK